MDNGRFYFYLIKMNYNRNFINFTSQLVNSVMQMNVYNLSKLIILVDDHKFTLNFMLRRHSLGFYINLSFYFCT